ncbi:hypothetical protein IJG21_02405 [Candidatus Saccharibacteria bacterium]|nr:hypothetical protein [Candidatus Saccharibacteria bacterium]
MKQFPDWDKEITDGELDESMKRCIELLNKAHASEKESETEVRLGRSEAYRLAGEVSDPRILAEKAAEYFNRSAIGIAQLLIVMTNTAINNEYKTPTIQFFFENLYDLAFLLNYIVENVIGIFSGGFAETAEEGDADYSAAVAKMGLQATIGAMFAAVHEVLATDRALIPEVMNEADEDMTVYDIMKMIKEDYLLIERMIDFEPTGGTEKPELPEQSEPEQKKSEPERSEPKKPKKAKKPKEKKTGQKKNRR